MRWVFLILSALAADGVDLSQTNYALRLAPRYLKGEKPGQPCTPCIVTASQAESLSRAQDALRLRELFLRVLDCGVGYVDVQLEDRSGQLPSTGAADLQAALQKEGWQRDATQSKRFLR